MKAKSFILLVLTSLAMLFVSCNESLPYSEKAYNDEWIVVEPSTISISEDELSGDFTISCSGEWSISDLPYWVNISPSSGYGYDNVKITVDENDGATRYGYVKLINRGDFTKEATLEIIQAPTRKKPFVINSVEVRNIDYDENVITNFGSTIYSYKTKYLQPKIYVSVNTPGSYTVYVKLYKPNGALSTGSSSPNGYSYSCPVKMYRNTTWYILSGWGNNTAGHWKAGNYRWEFWLNGEKIGEKSFKIY